jgi:hypothetical protein
VGGEGILDLILDKLPATGAWPALKYIRHDGYRSQGESNRDTYRMSWTIDSTGAPTEGTSGGPKHVVFAIHPGQVVPLTAVALWTSGHATLVATGAVDEMDAAPAKMVELPYGVVAQVRTADVMLPGGRGLSADVVVGRGEDVRTRAIAVAQAIAAGGAPPHGPERRAATSYDLRIVDDDDSPKSGLPSRERRVLAGIRVWGVVEYFHGIRRLNHDWENQLRIALPRLDAATDVDRYRVVLEEMLVPLNDGHTSVYSVQEREARAGTAIYWRRIDGKVVAGAFRDEAQAKAAGIALGDELVSNRSPGDQPARRSARGRAGRWGSARVGRRGQRAGGRGAARGRLGEGSARAGRRGAARGRLGDGAARGRLCDRVSAQAGRAGARGSRRGRRWRG